MTPEQVRAAVPSGGRADVAISGLGDVGSLLPGLFPDGHLVIDSVTARTNTADGVKVKGTGASGAFSGMGVEITFSALAGGTWVQAAATGDDQWTFTKAFPPLAGTIFDTLTFSNPVLTLDSTAAAMTFAGALIITTSMVPLAVLMPNVATHEIKGEITTVSGPPELGWPTTTVPSILLDGPDNQTIDLGLVRLEELRYEIEADPVFDYDLISWSVQAAVTVTGAIPVTVGGKKQVLVNTRILGWGKQLLFWGDFSELNDITLTDVARLFGQDDLTVPFDVRFPGGSQVKLTIVSVLVTLSPLAVDYVAFEVQTDQNWEVVTGQFTLDAIDLNLRIDSPLHDPKLSGSLSGLIGIGESGTLEVTAGFDEQSSGGQRSGEVNFGGALREGDGPLNLREVYTQFTGDDHPPVPDLSVMKFYFGLGVPSGDQSATFQAYLELDGEWHISDKVQVNEVMFSAQHDGTETTFDALAIFIIEGVAAKITAGYDSAPDKQWQFSGETGTGQHIEIGKLFQTIARDYGAIELPEPIAQLIIENVGVKVATGSNRTLFLTCEAEFPLDGSARADIVLSIDTGTRTFTAVMSVVVQLEGGTTFIPTFAIAFVGAQQKGQQLDPSMFVAVYTHPAGEQVPPLKALVAALSPTVAQYVPNGLSVDVKDAFLAKAGSAYLFGADLKVTIDFTNLPLIGSRLNLGVMGFDPLRLVAASAGLTDSQVKELDVLLAQEKVGALPDGALAAGFLFDGLLKLGTLEKPMAMPVAGQGAQKAPVPPAQPPAKDTTTADNALWYKVQRSFGPIYIDRVGVAYLHPPGEGAHLAVLLDASLTVAGLTLSLTGLQAGLDLSDLRAKPTFDLAGAGLSYTQGPLQITGAFLKGTVVYNKVSITAYGGEVVIKTASLTLGAIGSYMELPDGPSLFVYAFLNYAIGGPAFFFVTGLAAGFGYNRRFVPPALDKLADFPLVAEATGSKKPETSLSGELAALNDALPASPGDYFLTVGIHFTSFKMVDSFLLLVAAFGHRFELDLLGLATLVLPAAGAEEGNGPVTPVAEVQLALRATLVPEDGIFSLAAQLTPNSFLLSRDCHLFGGLAFSAWFAKEHAGDFVLSVGGYHPHYTVPSHYPAVPRLGFSWKVSDQLQMSGGAYFALTPSALMAGGTLSATYTDDSLQAWFDASMDFLIAWQPFHYTADLHVAIGASYTFSFFGTHTISAHVDANVHLEGPEFGGTAYIDLSVISFTITFGPAPNPPRAMDWDRFRTTLLPPAAQITTITLSGGALVPGKDSGTGNGNTNNDNDNDLGVIDPYALELRTDSVIPSTAGRRGHEGADAPLPTGGAPHAFGVSPLDQGNVTATHRIEITGAHGHVEDHFDCTPITKSLPYALWGGVLEPALTDPALTGPLLTGYIIRPLSPQEPAASPSLPAAALQSTIPLYTKYVIAWAPAEQDHLSGDGDQARAGTITRGLTAPGAADIRATIARALLKDAEISLDDLTAADFLQVPQVLTQVASS